MSMQPPHDTDRTPQMGRGTLKVFDGVDQLAQAAAQLFVQRSQATQAAQAPFRVALSGGSTPKELHRLLATSPLREQVGWSRVQFYWGDERNVGPESDQCNYRMARETLLQPLQDAGLITEDQVHRIRGELPAAQAAAEYEEELRRGFGLAPGQWPRFDLIFLGMGPDGHTASLFPHTAALAVRDRLVVANAVPQLSTERITLTVPVLNNAATVAFLVAGADKADALAAVLHGPPNPEQYPSQLVAPASGELHWLVDRAAAAKLPRA